MPGICSVALLELYLEDPGNTNFPEDYAPCAGFSSRCSEDGCACRAPASATASNGTTLDFVVCILLDDGDTCSGSDELDCDMEFGRDDNHPNATVAAATSTPAATIATPTPTATVTTATPTATAASSASTTATSISSGSESGAVAESTSSSSAAGSWSSASDSTMVTSASSSASASGSGSNEDVTSSSTSSSFSSMTTAVTVTVVLIVLLFAGLGAWFGRSYCVKRAAERKKQDEGSDGTATASPRAIGPTSTPASFPAFDRVRAQSAQRPRSGTNSRQPTVTPRTQRSRSRGALQSAPSHTSSSTDSSGASVFSGAVTNDGAAYFAQQAAFETPRTVSRPRQTSRPIQPVRLAEPRLGLSSTSSSRKTTVSSAPSSASTVVAGARGRPPPPPVPTDEARDVSGITSDSLSSVAWSSASEVSDGSGFYHLAPSRTAATAVLGATSDDEVSELGASMRRSYDAGRSTAASSSSFFSVGSDFTDDGAVDRRFGSRLGSMKEREF